MWSLQARPTMQPPRHRSPIGLVAGALAVGLGLTPACALAETAVERAARTGEISLGVYDDIPPYVMRKGDGDLEGYAIDVAGLIAEAVSDYLGKPVKVVSESSPDAEALFRQVHNGSIDLMCGAQFTWEREMFVDFSLPFGLSGIRLLTTQKGIDGTPDSLRGRRVGVIKGSLGEATLQSVQAQATLSPVSSFSEGISALRSGRIDALAGDTILIATAAGNADLKGGQLVPTLPYNRYAVACAMPENNSTLRNLVNLAIAQMVQGYVNDVPRYRELVNRWLGPGSKVGLPEEMIQGYFETVLLTHEQIRVPTTP